MSGKESIVKKIYNTRLKVAKYDIKYGDEDLTVAADSLREGRITIKQPGEGLKVEGRIRYVGYDQWTLWTVGGCGWPGKWHCIHTKNCNILSDK